MPSVILTCQKLAAFRQLRCIIRVHTLAALTVLLDLSKVRSLVRDHLDLVLTKIRRHLLLHRSLSLMEARVLYLNLLLKLSAAAHYIRK